MVKIVLLALLLTCFLLTLTIGTFPLSIREVIAAVFDDSDPVRHMIVADHRLPRALAAMGCGIALGAAGALFQTMLRNPLASPDWIGFTSGASFGALLAIHMFGGYLIVGALTGAAITASLVLALAFDRGLNIRNLVIIGIGANLMIGAAADLLLARVDLMTAADMSKWLVGALNGRDWSDAQLIWTGLVILAPALFINEFYLRPSILGDTTAQGLGMSLSSTRLATALLGILLVTLAVCVAGPLAFVAFVSAPIAKRLEGGVTTALLSASMIGGMIVLLADIASRFTPLVQLPTGVFTALVGAPILIWLLLLETRRGHLR
ncbi:MAG: iron chelate uptake ABC transporter family permease subunit [Pseudomonadota bacterium]